jgi:osmotically-inducible protein OsmY
MVSMARGEPGSSKGDADIREKLLAEIEAQHWAPSAMINVVVMNGVVELWGAVIDERQRAALKVAAENVPGVKAVNDHTVWIEPTSGMIIEAPEEATKH